MKTTRSQWLGVDRRRDACRAFGSIGMIIAGTWGMGIDSMAARGQGPLVLNTMVEEANEALYDGDYPKAIRLTASAMEKLKSPTLRKTLAQLSGDWLLAEGLLHGLQAEALMNSGSTSQARARLGTATRKVASRRIFYNNIGANTAIWWLYGAYIEFLEGDLDYKSPTYGMYSSVFKDKPPSQETVVSNNGKARTHYRRAADVLERLLKLDPTPNQEVVAGVPLHAHRLMVKLAVSMARTELVTQPSEEAEMGYPACLLPRAIDAEAYLTRARDMLRRNYVFREWLQPQGDDSDAKHLSYNLLQRYQELKKKGVLKGNAVSEQDVIGLKQLVYQAIVDYVLVNNASAEVEVIKEIVENERRPDAMEAIYAPSQAEQLYGNTRLFLRTQFRPDHPMCVETLMSMSRWYVYSSMKRKSEPPLLDYGRSLEKRVSYARDVLFYVRTISQDVIPESQRQELLWLERRALRNLRDLDAMQPFLNAAQLGELTSRESELDESLEKRLAADEVLEAQQ